jgi:hypothetical protein
VKEGKAGNSRNGKAKRYSEENIKMKVGKERKKTGGILAE